MLTLSTGTFGHANQGEALAVHRGGTSRRVIGCNTLCGNVQNTKYVLSDYRRAL